MTHSFAFCANEWVIQFPQSLILLLEFCFGVADPARCAASGGHAELRQEPLRQNQPECYQKGEKDPLIHAVIDFSLLHLSKQLLAISFWLFSLNLKDYAVC